MKLETHDDFGHAKRLNQPVVAYYRKNEEFAGRGIIIHFDADTVTFLNDKVGTFHFLRQNVYVFVEAALMN